MTADAVKAQTQEFQIYVGENFTVPNGHVIVVDRPPEEVVPPTPEVVSAHGPAQVIQGAILGNPWYNIEREVVAALLQFHELPADQRSRLLRWERNTVRAALWNRIQEILEMTDAERSPNDRLVVTELTRMFKEMRVQCAQNSINEYNRWYQSPNLFYPEPPFTYDRPPPANKGLYYLYGGPKPPSFEEFQAYGPLIYYRTRGNDAEFSKIASETAERNKTLVNALLAEGRAVSGGAAAGTVVATGVGIAIGAKIAVAATGKAILAVIAPFTKAASAVGGALGGSVIGVVVLAVITSVFEGIAVVDAAAVPGKLTQAFNSANQAVIDLPAISGAGLANPSEAQIRVAQELYGLFIGITLPDFAATEAAPPAVEADQKWLSSPLDSPLLPASSPVLQLLDHAGKKLSVRLLDGWFVVRDEGGTERIALSVNFQNGNGVKSTLTRRGSRFMITLADQDESFDLVQQFEHLTWSKDRRISKIGAGGPVATLSPSSLPDRVVGTPVNQVFQVANPGAGPYTFSVAPRSVLPRGLTLSASGVLSGIVTEPGNHVFDIHAVNNQSLPKPAQVTVRLRVAGNVAPAPAGLLAAYRFEGNENDALGLKNGLWSGTPAYAPGMMGQAASFSSTGNAWVNLPLNVFPRPMATAPRSFEIWFKTTSSGPILGQNATDAGGYVPAFYVGTNGKLHGSFFWRGPGSTPPFESSKSVNDGSWHHAAGTFDGSVQRFYLDGQSFGSGMGSTDYGSQSYTYTLGRADIGGWPNITSTAFDGQLDEAAIYSTALTPAEIQAGFEAGPNGRWTLALGNLGTSTGRVGTAFSTHVPVMDGPSAASGVSLAATGGALPFGLSTSGSSLTGTPRSAGTFTFTLQATNGTGHSGQRTYTMTIDGPVRPPMPEARAWWRCDSSSTSTDAGGTAFTSIPSNNFPISNVSPAAIVSGKVGQSYGNESVVASPSEPLLLAPGAIPTDGSAFTFETWFLAKGHGCLLKRTRNGSDEPVLWIGHDGLLRTHTSWFAASQAVLASSSRVDNGVWHHVAVTYANRTHQLYVDGVLAGVFSGLQFGNGTPLYDTTARYRLGGGPVYSNWHGITASGTPPLIAVDEPAVFGRVLTAADIQDIVASGKNGKSLFTISPATLPSPNFASRYSQTLTANGIAGPVVGPVTWTIAEGSLPPGLRMVTVGNTARITGNLTSARGSTFMVMAVDATGAAGSKKYTLTADASPAATLPGLVGWWRGESNYLDSNGSRHGTAMLFNPVFNEVEGGTAFLFNRFGGSLAIPPNSFPPLVRTPTIFDPARSNAPYTFEAWFATNQPGVILGRHNVPYFLPPIQAVPAIYVGTNGCLHSPMFSVAGSTSVSVDRVDDSRFHHVAVTYDGSSRRTYLDGALIGTIGGHTSEFNGITDVVDVGIGYNGAGATWPSLPTGWTSFSGVIDEVATYNRALSLSEIGEKFAAGSFGTTSATRTHITLSPGQVDQNYGVTVFATAEGKSYVSGAVPPGCTIAGNGILSGTPSSAGTYVFDVSTLQAGANWLLRRYTVRINGITAPRLADANWYRGDNGYSGFLPGQSLVAAGSVTIAPGRVGNGYRINSGGKLFMGGISFGPGGTWSYETWFKTAGSGILLSAPTVNGQSTAILSVLDDGRLRFEPVRSTAPGAVFATDAMVDDDRYHHVAITTGPDGPKLYLDGKQAATTTTDIPRVDPAESGILLGGGNFEGIIDEPQYHPFVLPFEEVLRVYAAGDLGKSILVLPNSLPTAATGSAYSASVTASGGTAPYAYRVVEGRLPNGITLAENGTLSGTPLVAGTFDIAIEATAANGLVGSKDYSLTVDPGIRFRGTDLVAWWSAEDHSNDWRGIHAAQPNAGLTYQPGLRGKAFSFRPPFGHSPPGILKLPASAFPSAASPGPFTFEAWFFARDTGVIAGRENTVDFSSIPLLYVGVDGKLRAQMKFDLLPAVAESSAAVIDGNWHHVAMAHGDGMLDVYLDGQLVASQPSPAPLLGSGERVVLGTAAANGWPLSGDSGAGFYFDGLIDEPATWSRRLNASDIAFLAACGPNGKADAIFNPAGTLPAATRGRPYSVVMNVTGASAPPLSLIEGSLPAGFSLPAFAGETLGGTPVSTGISNFVLRSQSTSGPLPQRQRIEERFRVSVDPYTTSASYDLWIGPAGLSTAASMPGASPSAGMENLLRYAFNLTPGSADRAILVPGTGTSGLPWSGVDAQGRLVIEFVRRKASGNPGITYAVETGVDPGSLAALSLTAAVVTSIDATWERVRITDPSATSKRFGRVRVDIP